MALCFPFCSFSPAEVLFDLHMADYVLRAHQGLNFCLCMNFPEWLLSSMLIPPAFLLLPNGAA